jgi:hypothetical protein
MKNLRDIFILCLVSFCCNLGSQNDLDNHKKYWYYKSRLNNDFIKVGNTPTNNNNNDGHGESIPFNERNFAWGPNGYSPGLEMKCGDEGARTGIYLAALATEYRLLKNNSQDVTRVKHEIFCALNAINRMDYFAESELPSPQPNNLNGFIIRGDTPPDFVYDNYEHFNYYNNGVPANPNIVTSDKGFTTLPFQNTTVGVTQCNGGFGVSAVEESQDQAYYLLMGLTLTNKLVDAGETDGANVFGYGSGQTQLREEAAKVAGRLIKYIKSDPLWVIRNPNTNAPVSAGPNTQLYCYALDNLGCYIEYGQSMPFWYIPYITGPGAYPHASCTDYRNLYSFSPAASLGWQTLAAAGGGPPVDAQGFFHCLASTGNNVFEPKTLLDLNVQAQIQAVQLQISNAINNANQQIQNILSNLPNWVPQWLANATATAISAITNALQLLVNNLQAVIATLNQALNPSVLINTTDDRLLYNSISNSTVFFNDCLFPPQSSTPLFHLGSDLYFGTYIRDILHGYNFNLPNWLQWINNVAAPGHTVIKNTVKGILNTAPCEGNFNYGSPNNFPPANSWGASCFLDRPDRLWNKSTCTQFLGDYSGTDYLLLHNLYYLTEGTTNPMEDYIDRIPPTNYPQGNQFTLSNIQTFGAFEHIKAYNTVNSNGGAEYRTGKEIALVPTPNNQSGFSAVLGCDFAAVIDRYPCSAISPNENMNRVAAPQDDFGKTPPKSTPPVKNTTPPGNNPSNEFMSQVQNALTQQMDSINNEFRKITKVIREYNKVNVYPNPSSGKFIVEFNLDEGDNVDLEVSNMLGVPMMNQKYVTGFMKLPIDLTNEAKGVYLVKCRFSNGKEDVRKITIQ